MGKMLKKTLIPILLILLLFTFFGEAQTVLRVAHTSSVTHPNQAGLRLMAELVKEKTNGEIEIKVFGGGVLGGERDVNESVQLGTIEMTLTTTGVLENFVPSMGILSLPFLFTDTEHFREFERSEVALDLLATSEKHGYKGLGFCVPVFREPLTKGNPIDKPADFEGKKIRLMEVPIHMDTYAALGASPTPIAYSEVYSSLQLGVVDGCENALASLMDMKFYEVTDSLTRLPVFSNACILVMNLDIYNKLTEDQQNAIMESARIGLDLIDEGYLARGEEALKVMKDAGIDISTPQSIEPFIEATQSVYDKNLPKLPEGSKEIIERIKALAYKL